MVGRRNESRIQSSGCHQRRKKVGYKRVEEAFKLEKEGRTTATALMIFVARNEVGKEEKSELKQSPIFPNVPS